MPVPLQLDPSFRERVAALGALTAGIEVQPLDEMLAHLKRFTTVRRHEVRLARLQSADHSVAEEWRTSREKLADACEGLREALKLLLEQARSLRPLIIPELDEVIVLAANADHPLRGMFAEVGLSLEFADYELAWLFDELAAIHYRPVRLVCWAGFEDLTSLLSSVSQGEAGLLIAGFPRRTGDPQSDERLEKLIIRLREQGVTPSLFLAIIIVLTAHAVAVHAGRSSSTDNDSS